MLLLAWALLFPACWPLSCLNCLAKEPPPPPPKPGSFSYQISCDTAIGTVKTWVTYTVQASSEPVTGNQAVEYDITAPVARVDTGVTATFEKAVETFNVPNGFVVDSVKAAVSSTPDFTSAVAELQNGQIVYTLTGAFTLDKTERPVPPIEVHGRIVGAAGSTVTWMPPVRVDAQANAGFFGDQTSTCHFEQPGPIWTSHID